ncbi:MAG: DUF1501 domain-containing protein [Pseudomonadota bacterium]|nr:DUF1501 domain-containing protein [Pseudomonadota bacterium]
MLSRRALLRASSGLLGAAALHRVGAPGRARAASGAALKFIFVVAYGGWDPTRVFAPEFANPAVVMEPEAQERSAAGLRYVDHPDRPNVRAFFDRHAARSVVFNGVGVASIAHESCLRICLTGRPGPDGADWGAILGAARTADFPIPHIVIGGPSFPGAYAAAVTRTGTNAQLAALLSGDLAAWSDLPFVRPTPSAETVMNTTVERRVAAALARARPGAEAALVEGLGTALDRAAYLQGLGDGVVWDTTTFGGQARLAVDLLALQVSRVATLAYATQPWDTHVDNDVHQSAAFEGLFAALLEILALLEAQPGQGSGTLADETVLVVLSEMGRAPVENVYAGKDHWPATSALLVGPGLQGGRTIGAFDDGLYGCTIDLVTGEPAEGGAGLDAAGVGATLLHLAGLDPEEHVPGAPAVLAALA